MIRTLNCDHRCSGPTEMYGIRRKSLAYLAKQVSVEPLLNYLNCNLCYSYTKGIKLHQYA